MTVLTPQHALVTKPRLHYVMLANTRACAAHAAILRPNFDQFFGDKMNTVVISDVLFDECVLKWHHIHIYRL